MQIDIGIPETSRLKIGQALCHLLSDTFSLYLKTHHFHWNVTGPHFSSLHLLFETQYNELWLAADTLAERIRTLGMFAPGTYQQFSKLSSIEEEPSVPSWQDMIKQLVSGHETLAKSARKSLSLSTEVHDEGTADLLAGRISLHEKTAWMLRSLLA